MLTPRELMRTEFKRVWKGYSVDEVDDFVRRVVSAYETIHLENQALKERVGELKKQVQTYSNTEQQIQDALQLARQTADQTRRALKQEAEATVHQTTMKANQVLLQARQQLESELGRVRQLRNDEAALRMRLRNLLETYLGFLDEPDPTDWDDSIQGAFANLEEAAATHIREWKDATTEIDTKAIALKLDEINRQEAAADETEGQPTSNQP